MIKYESHKMKEFLTVSEASFYTSKSEITIRRLLSEHKNNKTDIRKINGKISIRVTFLSKYYTLKSDEQKLKSDEHEHEKQKASLILEKQNKDIINENQQIIKELINQTNKKSYSWVYIVLGFIALMAVMCGFGYLYRARNSFCRCRTAGLLRLLLWQPNVQRNILSDFCV